MNIIVGVIMVIVGVYGILVTAGHMREVIMFRNLTERLNARTEEDYLVDIEAEYQHDRDL